MQFVSISEVVIVVLKFGSKPYSLYEGRKCIECKSCSPIPHVEILR